MCLSEIIFNVAARHNITAIADRTKSQLNICRNLGKRLRFSFEYFNQFNVCQTVVRNGARKTSSRKYTVGGKQGTKLFCRRKLCKQGNNI